MASVLSNPRFRLSTAETSGLGDPYSGSRSSSSRRVAPPLHRPHLCVGLIIPEIQRIGLLRSEKPSSECRIKPHEGLLGPAAVPLRLLEQSWHLSGPSQRCSSLLASLPRLATTALSLSLPLSQCSFWSWGELTCKLTVANCVGVIWVETHAAASESSEAVARAHGRSWGSSRFPPP